MSRFQVQRDLNKAGVRVRHAGHITDVQVRTRLFETPFSSLQTLFCTSFGLSQDSPSIIYRDHQGFWCLLKLCSCGPVPEARCTRIGKQTGAEPPRGFVRGATGMWPREGQPAGTLLCSPWCVQRAPWASGETRGTPEERGSRLQGALHVSCGGHRVW